MANRFTKTLRYGWDVYRGNVTLEDDITDFIKEKAGNVICPIATRTSELKYQGLLAVGAAGCGKSTYFQKLIKDNIIEAKKGKCTMISIDPVQANDVIIEYAGVERYSNAILIDPSDPDSLPCLDIFETSQIRDPRLQAANMIGVFKDVCAGLVETDLTSQMKTLFAYCAKVAVVMENCGLRDLLQLLTQPIETLESLGFAPDHPVREFFQEEVVGTGRGRVPMADTARSLRARVHNVLADPIIERLFCHAAPTLSIGKAINTGSMIFVCTRKGDLSQDGARLLGNYFLTMIHRTMQERVNTRKEDMMETNLYYDEVQNALNGNPGSNDALAAMLDENRKYKLAVHVATTRMGHFNVAMGDALVSGCETKLVGKMSSRGAGTLVADMFPGTPGAINDMLKLPNYKFYCRVRTKHEQAIKVSTAPDPIRKLGKKNPNAMKVFRQRMNLKYGQGFLDMKEIREGKAGNTVETMAQSPVPAASDAGGLGDVGAL